ncbi:MAG: hypothetical protein ACE5Q6_12995, partial [Dehalococcoidia bacterium]
SGQNLFQQQRLAAVGRLWTSVLELREHFSRPVIYFTILEPSEYDSVFEKGGPLSKSISDFDNESTALLPKQTAHVEKDRPDLGETLWYQFYSYRAFIGRIGYLIREGIRQGHFTDWRDDPGVHQLLCYVLSEQQYMPLLNSKKDPSALYKALGLLESLILREISLITSGRQSSFESFENAEELRDALSGLRPTEGQPKE